jgi:hypothetical protein
MMERKKKEGFSSERTDAESLLINLRVRFHMARCQFMSFERKQLF